jgi:acyl-coenzyme A thioesterase 9
LRRRIKPENAYWMDETKLKSVIICQPEQRNIYNKIFGGFLMRKAYELAWVNSCIFSQEKTEIAFVEHVSFKKPVVIGSLLFLTAQVVYTEGNSIMVNVHAEVQDPLTQKRDVTNEFYYKFIVPHKLAVPRVIPKSYSEAMIYIVGKRHW